MPKNCPLNKQESHACWECIFHFGNSCTYVYGSPCIEVSKDVAEKVGRFIKNDECDCNTCFYFSVCSQYASGIRLEKCKHYVLDTSIPQSLETNKEN